MPISADSSDLAALKRDLDEMHRKLMPEVRQVVSRGALNVKRDWGRRWEGHRSIRHLPGSINYDLAEGPNFIEAEIGADHARLQGNLAHLIEFANNEYGTLRNAPIPGGQPALDDEQPRFVRAIADVGEKVLGGRARY